MRLASRARQMSWRDRAEVISALVTAVVIEVGLRSIRLPDLAQRLGVPYDASPQRVDECLPCRLPPWAERRLHLSNRVMDRWPFGGTCLRRSLLVGSRLRELHPLLRIGVSRDEGLRAHAWIDIDGKSLDPAASLYSVLEEVGT